MFMHEFYQDNTIDYTLMSLIKSEESHKRKSTCEICPSCGYRLCIVHYACYQSSKHKNEHYIRKALFGAILLVYFSHPCIFYLYVYICIYIHISGNILWNTVTYRTSERVTAIYDKWTSERSERINESYIVGTSEWFNVTLKLATTPIRI